MKITTSIPLGIKLKDYKVSLQIGDVLVRDKVNVRPFNDRLKSFKGEHNHAPTFCESTMILLGSDFQFQ
jgi:hypothetical protein